MVQFIYILPIYINILEFILFFILNEVFNNSALIQYGKVSLSQQTYTFNQPTLSSEGTLGGNSFAITKWLKPDGSTVSMANANGNNTINLLNNTCIAWGSPHYASTINDIYFVFYNPNALKVSSFDISDTLGASAAQYSGYSSNHAGYGPFKQITIYGSNTNSNWTQLTTFTNSSKLNSLNLPVNSTTAYKYHKFVINSAWAYSASMAYLKINATYYSSVLNSITFPTSFTSSNSYGAAFTYLNSSSSSAYVSNKTASGMSLSGVDTNSSSAIWIASGY